MPLVSVILPAFNAEKSISRSVRSILAQSLNDLELIVVDDGSTDRTVNVLDQIHDRRMRVIKGLHQGVASAFNLGMKHASSNLIARMDADDFSYSDRLQTQRDFLLEHDVDAVGCRVRIVDREGQSVDSLGRYQRWINEETLTGSQISALRFVELPLVNPTILARRDYFGSGYRNSDLPEDYDLFLSAAAAGMRFGKVRQVLFDWTDGDSRLTRTDPRYSLQAFTACRRMHLLKGPLRGVAEIDIWGAGKSGKPWLRWVLTQDIPVRNLIEVSPAKIGQRIHGVPVVDCRNMPPFDGTPMLIAVGADRARQMIWPHLEALGYEIGATAWFVA